MVEDAGPDLTGDLAPAAPAGAAAPARAQEPDPDTWPARAGALWRRLQARLWGAPGEDDLTARLATLAQAIEAHPEAPGNYVLRAELWLALGDPAEAAVDFHRALERAERQLAAHAWGVIAQVIRDRALAGLAQAERQLALRRPDEFGLHYPARSEDVSEMERW